MAIKKPKKPVDHVACKGMLRPLLDAVEVLSGRWKMPILQTLMEGNKRFKQISKEVNGISDKVLSKELKELEINQLIKREVHNTFPPTVEYSITPHGSTLEKVFFELGTWGLAHRKRIIGK